MVRPYLREAFALRLTDRDALREPAVAGETFVAADLADQAQMAALLEGAAGVLHLGGQSVEAGWDTVNAANIQGLYGLLEACRTAKVPRVVFASSNHAVGFYPRARTIDQNARVRPDSLYGVSKAFGEALCALYADKFGLRVMAIRIGNIAPKPLDRRRLAIWQHPEDLAALVTIGLTHPDVHNALVYGVSDNARSWWDNAAAEALGYRPKHRAADHEAAVLEAPEAEDPVGDVFQGGSFCSDGFIGDLSRTKADASR